MVHEGVCARRRRAAQSAVPNAGIRVGFPPQERGLRPELKKESILYGNETYPQKAPRGGLIRWLTGDEETAVKNISGRKTSAGREEYILAEKVLLEMRQREAASV